MVMLKNTDDILVCTSKKLVDDTVFNFTLEVFFLTPALGCEVVQCDRD